MLDDVDELRELFARRGTEIRNTRVEERSGYVPPEYRIEDDPPRLPAGHLFCPTCGGPRKMLLRALYVPVNFPETPPPRAPEMFGTRPVDPHVHPLEAIAPSFFSLMCSQCSALFTLAVVHRDGREQALVLPEGPGGIGTPRTPDSVRYYLEQAHLSRAVGAFGAAVAMYRAALEHLLFAEGYKERMLGPKIRQLEEAVEAGTAPTWARDLDPEYWNVIGRLGNAVIHPNEGDIGPKRRAVDGALVLEVDELFGEILEAAYELPHQRAERLRRLKAAHQDLVDGPETAADETP